MQVWYVQFWLLKLPEAAPAYILAIYIKNYLFNPART